MAVISLQGARVTVVYLVKRHDPLGEKICLVVITTKIIG